MPPLRLAESESLTLLLLYLPLMHTPFLTSTATLMGYQRKPKTLSLRQSRAVGQALPLSATRAQSNSSSVSVTQRTFQSISVSPLMSLSFVHLWHPALVNMVEVPLAAVYLLSKLGTSLTISSGRAAHVCDMYSTVSQTEHPVALDTRHVPQSMPR